MRKACDRDRGDCCTSVGKLPRNLVFWWRLRGLCRVAHRRSGLFITGTPSPPRQNQRGRLDETAQHSSTRLDCKANQHRQASMASPANPLKSRRGGPPAASWRRWAVTRLTGTLRHFRRDGSARCASIWKWREPITSLSRRRHIPGSGLDLLEADLIAPFPCLDPTCWPGWKTGNCH